MVINKYTGPGSLKLGILTEADVSIFTISLNNNLINIPPQIFIVGEEDVPQLVTPKSDIMTISPHVSYKYE